MLRDGLMTLLVLLVALGGRGLAASHRWIEQPPKGWECIEDPAQLPAKVKVIYVGAGTGQSQFTPSINVAAEETTLSLTEYTEQACSYHAAQEHTTCLHIGKLQTPLGIVELLQIDRPSRWGDIRFIQGIFLRQAEAYVITATCLKHDFGTLSPQLFRAIQTFAIESN